MSEELLIRHCSPTLAGLKTGNLFSCAVSSTEELYRSLRQLNRRLVPKGLRVLPLRLEKGRALIYLYRVSGLRRDLADRQAQEILLADGYEPQQMDRCIRHLIERLHEQGEFPHEIGLFLSYPPEDVRGFIENHACGHKCVGCWKVYGDEEAARKCFARYDKCSRIYAMQWAEGKSLERLTVAG